VKLNAIQTSEHRTQNNEKNKNIQTFSRRHTVSLSAKIECRIVNKASALRTNFIYSSTTEFNRIIDISPPCSACTAEIELVFFA